MVSGIVRPPAIELANRDLVRAHLHAIWLAESGKELAADIPHVLDLTTEALPVQEEVAQAFAAPDLKPRAAAAMRARPRQHRCRADARGRPLGHRPGSVCGQRRRMPPRKSSRRPSIVGGSFMRARALS